MNSDLQIWVARKDLERRLGRPDTRFRNEWQALVAAAKYQQRLARERGRLEMSVPAPSGCCARHSHA
jgi:hypothetical protein